MLSSTHNRLLTEERARAASVITGMARKHVEMESRAFLAEAYHKGWEGEAERRAVWIAKMVAALRASAEHGCDEVKAVLKEWDTPVRWGVRP